MAARSQVLTRQHFGRTMRLFAPLYLSNECINNCKYCGFSRDNPILRVTLPVAEVVAEARHLAAEGFRNVLLVAGEHPKFVSSGYLEACVRAVCTRGRGAGGVPRSRPDGNGGIPAAGGGGRGGSGRISGNLPARGLRGTAYRRAETQLSTGGWTARSARTTPGSGGSGSGRFSGWRIGGRRRLVLGAHVDYLLRRCWKAHVTVSLPRLRPAAGGFAPRFPFADRDLVQLLCALRLSFPQVGLVLSTREAAGLRDALVPLGITMMSAGSHTEPGGYTGVGREDLHLTVRGRRCDSAEASAAGAQAEGQFDIADTRSPREVADTLRRQHGLEPVWKDWDEGLIAP